MFRNAADVNVGDGEDMESRRQALGEALGLSEPHVIETLEQEGLRPDLLALLWLAPAVAMSWADGTVTRREQRVIGTLTQSDRVRATGRLGARLLNRWMTARPSEAFFRAAMRALAATIARLPDPERERACARVMAGLVDVARVSGGMLSVGTLSREEEQWLREVQAELEARPRMTSP